MTECLYCEQFVHYDEETQTWVHTDVITNHAAKPWDEKPFWGETVDG
jgi:hypothetical protein